MLSGGVFYFEPPCIMYAQLSPMLGPFWLTVDYLLVADFHHLNIYQLKPDSGEVRAIPIPSCQPFSLTFDPSINGIYVTCLEFVPNSRGRFRYRIRKKTFDGKIDRTIYNAPDCKEHCLYCSRITVISRTILHLEAGHGTLEHSNYCRHDCVNQNTDVGLRATVLRPSLSKLQCCCRC